MSKDTRWGYGTVRFGRTWFISDLGGNSLTNDASSWQNWGISEECDEEVGLLHTKEKGCISNWPTLRAGNPGSRKPGTGGKILAEEAKKNYTLARREGEDQKRRAGKNQRDITIRIGVEQYEWEEPRVTEAQSDCGAVDLPHRVDRLRLLGNGVVPQTAELYGNHFGGRSMNNFKNHFLRWAVLPHLENRYMTPPRHSAGRVVRFYNDG